MTKTRLAAFFLTFGLGVAVGWIVRSDDHRQPRATGIAIAEGTPVRVIFPNEDGSIRSVPLRVHRIETEPREATGDRDKGQPWIFAVGDPLNATWVYASTPSQ